MLVSRDNLSYTISLQNANKQSVNSPLFLVNSRKIRKYWIARRIFSVFRLISDWEAIINRANSLGNQYDTGLP